MIIAPVRNKLRLLFLLFGFWLTFINGQACADSLAPPEIMARAERGDAAAQYELGRMYQGGRAVTQDYGKAVDWYRRSAEQGYAPPKEASAKCIQAVMAGFAGTMRRQRNGTAKPPRKAISWRSSLLQPTRSRVFSGVCRKGIEMRSSSLSWRC